MRPKESAENKIHTGYLKSGVGGYKQKKGTYGVHDDRSRGINGEGAPWPRGKNSSTVVVVGCGLRLATLLSGKARRESQNFNSADPQHALRFLKPGHAWGRCIGRTVQLNCINSHLS